MKKKFIWIIVGLMSFFFVGLLIVQVFYFYRVVEIRRSEFNENVNHSLARTVHHLEQQAAQQHLAQQMGDSLGEAMHNCCYKALAAQALVNTQQRPIANSPSPSANEKAQSPSKNADRTPKQKAKSISEKALHSLNQWEAELLSSDSLLLARISPYQLETELNHNLLENGIDLLNTPYHYQLLSLDQRVIFQCEDYESNPQKDAYYEKKIFNQNSPRHVGIIRLNFTNAKNYTFESTFFILPGLLFTILLIITYIATVILVFRQKKISEIKNDFINNLTHEFKTPISAISLASQMLEDKSVSHNETLVQKYSHIIAVECKRLSMQVEKVLQMAMFDRADISTFKFQETDAHSIIHEVVSNFEMKVNSEGGKIEVDYGAADPILNADTMHFTNLIYNILDNGLKYRRPQVPILLHISTANDEDYKMLHITISDNGIGIAREDLKNIFERFFRVSTGNVHNVKGVGIGLAYVASVVKAHKGTISVESELDEGTSFTISVPLFS